MEAMGNSLKTDRREHRRLELTNLVAYSNFRIEEVTETMNISMGGMKIKTEFPIDQNASLDVALRIGNEEFKSEAKVVYCNSREDQAYEVGLRFEKTSEAHLNLLGQYLSSHNQSSLETAPPHKTIGPDAS
jgi:c-di-GMP-binding flagellar brake protein YcgR